MSSSVKIVRWAVFAALAVAAIVAVAFAARSLAGSEPSDTRSAGTPTAEAPATSASAPTTAGAGVSGSPDGDTAAPSTTASSTASRPPSDPVDVLIRQTYSGWDPDASAIVVGAVVTGVIESGGTCTLTVGQGLTEHTATSKGSADASTTTCGRMSVTGADMSAGEWTAQLTYESPAANGESEFFSVVVP